MTQDAKDAFEKTSLGAQNKAYDLIAQMDPEYFDKLKGLYVDGTFGREGALPRKTKELIMVGICCALNRPRGVKLHSERALTLGVAGTNGYYRNVSSETDGNFFGSSFRAGDVADDKMSKLCFNIQRRVPA